MMIIDYGTMKCFEHYLAFWIVGNHAHKLTGTQRRDFRCRNSIFELLGTTDRGVGTVQRIAFPVLQYLSETLGKLFCRISIYLPGQHVSRYVHDHVGLLTAIILAQLT